MPAEPESYEERIARLARQYRRARLPVLGINIAGGLAIFCLLLAWLLHARSPSGNVFDWASDILAGIMVFFLVILGGGRPKFIRKFFYGPERQLSDEEKAAQARRDLMSKNLETLTRPISWAFSVSFSISMMISILWLIGEFKMTTWFAVALIALATVAGLSLWGLRRITVYFYKHQ